jgi:hypothetical protein
MSAMIIFIWEENQKNNAFFSSGLLTYQKLPLFKLPQMGEPIKKHPFRQEGGFLLNATSNIGLDLIIDPNKLVKPADMPPTKHANTGPALVYNKPLEKLKAQKVVLELDQETQLTSFEAQNLEGYLMGFGEGVIGSEAERILKVGGAKIIEIDKDSIQKSKLIVKYDPNSGKISLQEDP